MKAGFTVEYRKTAPERDTDFGRRDLDVTTWIVFLVHKGDEKLAVDLGYHYLNLDHREREQREKNAKADIATEGGHNLQTYSRKRGHPGESVSFVGTDVPLKMQKTASFGPESAGRLMAEVVLHKPGHAMGHVHYEGDDASKDHASSGIMAAGHDCRKFGSLCDHELQHGQRRGDPQAPGMAGRHHRGPSQDAVTVAAIPLRWTELSHGSTVGEGCSQKGARGVARRSR